MRKSPQSSNPPLFFAAAAAAAAVALVVVAGLLGNAIGVAMAALGLSESAPPPPPGEDDASLGELELEDAREREAKGSLAAAEEEGFFL